MDPLLAWDRWNASVGPSDGRPAASAYPWSVRRFLTVTRKRRLEDYTEFDLREFVFREAGTAYERRHYERAVRSFFAWCRDLAVRPQPPGPVSGTPKRHGASSWPLIQPLARLAVVVTLAIVLEVSLATTLVRLAR
jgi:hypothetical protein